MSSNETKRWLFVVIAATMLLYVGGLMVANTAAADIGGAQATPGELFEIPEYDCEDGYDNDGDTYVDAGNDRGCDGDHTEAPWNPPPENPQCSNTRDDDGDGKVDHPADPGCSDPGDAYEGDDPQPPACRNGYDDDGDGSIDYPADRGCSSTEDDNEADDPAAECQDSFDNDGDGKIDFPADPECAGYEDNSEAGGGAPQCRDTYDNDGDGKIDFPADRGCENSDDNSEDSEGNSNCTGKGVYLWEHAGHTGRCWKFDDTTPDLGEAKNLVSSAQTRGDYLVTLTGDTGFGGGSTVFSGDPPDPSGWEIGDNNAESIVVIARSDAPYLVESRYQQDEGNAQTAAIPRKGCIVAKEGTKTEHPHLKYTTSTYKMRVKFCWDQRSFEIKWRDRDFDDKLPFPLSISADMLESTKIWEPGKDSGKGYAFIHWESEVQGCYLKWGCLGNALRPWIKMWLYETGVAICQRADYERKHLCEREEG